MNKLLGDILVDSFSTFDTFCFITLLFIFYILLLMNTYNVMLL